MLPGIYSLKVLPTFDFQKIIPTFDTLLTFLKTDQPGKVCSLCPLHGITKVSAAAIYDKKMSIYYLNFRLNNRIVYLQKLSYLFAVKQGKKFYEILVVKIYAFRLIG